MEVTKSRKQRRTLKQIHTNPPCKLAQAVEVGRIWLQCQFSLRESLVNSLLTYLEALEGLLGRWRSMKGANTRWYSMEWQCPIKMRALRRPS